MWKKSVLVGTSRLYSRALSCAGLNQLLRQHSILGGFCVLRAGFEGFTMDMEGQHCLPQGKDTVPPPSAQCHGGGLCSCPKAAAPQLRAGSYGWLQTPSFWMLPLWMDVRLSSRGDNAVPQMAESSPSWEAGTAAARASRDPVAARGGRRVADLWQEEPGVSPSAAGGELPWRWANKAPRLPALTLLRLQRAGGRGEGAAATWGWREKR